MGCALRNPSLNLIKKRGALRWGRDPVESRPRAWLSQTRVSLRPRGGLATLPSEDPRPRGTWRRAGVGGRSKAPGRREFLKVPESLSLGQVSPPSPNAEIGLRALQPPPPPPDPKTEASGREGWVQTPRPVSRAQPPAGISLETLPP